MLTCITECSFKINGVKQIKLLFIIGTDLRKSIMRYNDVNSRIVTIRIKATPVNISIAKIYSQTLDTYD